MNVGPSVKHLISDAYTHLNNCFRELPVQDYNTQPTNKDKKVEDEAGRQRLAKKVNICKYKFIPQ